MAYESRLSCSSRRAEYRLLVASELMSSYSELLEGISDLSVAAVAIEIAFECEFLQDILMLEIELPEGISKCGMLKENIMMMAVCIELNIPLFIVGKPGTSKSLAKKLVCENMKGSRSHARLFRHFKCVTMFSYQSSPHTTSEDIQSIWDKALLFLQGKDRCSFTSVIFLDEIGLAEDSRLMPLKVLHPLLEHAAIGFVGLSNWAIDPAKMNRGVFLSRSDPNKEDLVCTARGIAKDARMLQRMLFVLTESYLYVHRIASQKGISTAYEIFSP